MSANEILEALIAWTPRLAQGFLWNILIALASMVIGTILGSGLASLRLAESTKLQGLGASLTNVARNIPTFVFLYYLAFLLPTDIDLLGFEFRFPAWLKASFALAIAVVGFVSDNLTPAVRAWREGRTATALLFLPSWTTYFVIILMTTSTASLIGVPDIVGTCNTIIGAVGSTDLMLWIYLYAMLWFFVPSLAVTLLMGKVKQWTMQRLASPAVGAAT